jgi:Matrixin
MIRSLGNLRKGDAERRRRHAARPRLESLEDRMLLYAAYGGTWVYGQRITYSFVPDGTNIGGLSSNLFATMNKVAPTATWEAAFEKAAAIWSTYANINLALVSDNGEVSGASGNQQDDPNVGDIRIGMTPQSGGTLAITFLPPPFNGGTLAGDMVLNSKVTWGMNTGADIETVALHEFGHALGLGENTTDPSTVMYQSYTGIKQNLAPDDIAGIQSIWGAQPTDTTPNQTFQTAQDLTPLIDSNAQIALSGLKLSPMTGGDYDWFKATVPTTTNGTMTITLQSANLSSATLHLVVENSAGKVLGQASSTDLGGTVSYTVTGVTPGQVYDFRASSQTTPGIAGAYGVLVNFGSHAQNPIAPPNTVVAQQPDKGSGTDFLHAGLFGKGLVVQQQIPGMLALGSILSVGDALTVAPSLLSNGPGWASLMPPIFSLMTTTLAPGADGSNLPGVPSFAVPIAPLFTPGILDSVLAGLSQSVNLLDQLALDLTKNIND